MFKENLLIYILFLLSGVSALAYQVIWQRVLFSTFGVNIDSITIIVSTFMLGLGLGALIGGKLADFYKNKQIILFILIEILIGTFGFFSYEIIAYVGNLFVLSTSFVIFIVNFSTLLIPTILMGATLPILITYIYRSSKNIGYATGILYSYNTFGAAIGALIVGFVALMYYDIPTTIKLISANNFIIAFFAFLISTKAQNEAS